MTTKTCPVCQTPLEKRANESQSTFDERITCSIKCGAIYRQSAQKEDKAAIMEQAALCLAEIVRGWHKPNQPRSHHV